MSNLSVKLYTRGNSKQWNIMLNKSTFVDTEKTQNLLNLEPRILDWGQSMIQGGGDLDNESVYSERH